MGLAIGAGGWKSELLLAAVGEGQDQIGRDPRKRLTILHHINPDFLLLARRDLGETLPDLYGYLILRAGFWLSGWRGLGT